MAYIPHEPTHSSQGKKYEAKVEFYNIMLQAMAWHIQSMRKSKSLQNLIGDSITKVQFL